MNPIFKRKLQFTIPFLVLLLILSLSSNRSLSFTAGLLVGFSIVLFALYIKTRKEDSNPSYFQDERTMKIAYKADSITLKITIISISLLFFIESLYQISKYITLYGLLGTLLFITLALKICIFYYLNRV